VHRLPPSDGRTARLCLPGGDRKNIRPIFYEICGYGSKQAEMKKADYRQIATTYDRGRKLSEKNIDLWLGIISRLAKAREGARLLDLGCGTGRFAIPIAKKLNYKVTGADSSAEMLAKAREKDTTKLVKWDIEDAQDLSYPDNAFDIVFMSHLLHHCDDPEKVIRECWRVLSPEGVLLNRHSVFEEIRSDPESTFFPEARAINESRISSLKDVIDLFREAGFINIVSEKIVQRTSENGNELYARMTNKNVSALAMISQEAFERGLKRVKEYVEKHPDNPWLLYDTMRMTAGYKSLASC
jgi:ubiquinone/menaquinone biosynthesis C-methylase UbiE